MTIKEKQFLDRHVSQMRDRASALELEAHKLFAERNRCVREANRLMESLDWIEKNKSKFK